MWHVELIEAWSLTVGFGNFFDGIRAGGGETVGEIEFFGDGCNGKLTVLVIDLVDTDGGETNGCRYWSTVNRRWWGESQRPTFMTEDRCAGVAKICINELSWNDLVTVECLS